MADGFLGLDESVVETDDGFLTTQTSNYTFPTVGLIDRSATGSMRGELFNLFIGSSGDKQVYHRSYIKIADIFAQVEGIASAVLIVLVILIYPFMKVKYYEDLFNSLYEYDSDTQQFQIRTTKSETTTFDKLKASPALFQQQMSGKIADNQLKSPGGPLKS